MSNYNPYSELDFKNRFKNSRIYNQLKNDFDHLFWDKSLGTVIPYQRFYEGLTPRQWAGETIFYVAPFYYLEKLTETNPTNIYDIGCGWNRFKRYIPNILGIDKRPINSELYYADIEGIVDDSFVNSHQQYFESAFSIDALHFHSLSTLEKIVNDFVSMIKINGRGFLALNLQRMIEQTSDTEMINLFNTTSPTVKQYDDYIRTTLLKIKCNYLIIDIDLSTMDEYMNGNIRIVFERKW